MVVDPVEVLEPLSISLPALSLMSDPVPLMVPLKIWAELLFCLKVPVSVPLPRSMSPEKSPLPSLPDPMIAMVPPRNVIS